MKPVWISWCALLLAFAASAADAATIYKCRQAGGVVSYQDQPCPGRQISVIRTSATAAPAKAPKATAGGAAAPAAAGAARARPTSTGRTPRPSFKCTRPDQSHYFTGDIHPKRTLVDLPKAGTNLLPVPGAPAAPPGKMWAQDQCENSTRSESCQYYQEQIDYNEAQQKRASGDELRQLTREGRRLRAIHSHRCT